MRYIVEFNEYEITLLILSNPIDFFVDARFEVNFIPTSAFYDLVH